MFFWNEHSWVAPANLPFSSQWNPRQSLSFLKKSLDNGFPQLQKGLLKSFTTKVLAQRWSVAIGISSSLPIFPWWPPFHDLPPGAPLRYLELFQSLKLVSKPCSTWKIFCSSVRFACSNRNQFKESSVLLPQNGTIPPMARCAVTFWLGWNFEECLLADFYFP